MAKIIDKRAGKTHEQMVVEHPQKTVLPGYGGGSGGASSWNDLTDKPFYEETELVNEPLNITWDGNTEGLVNSEGFLFKVSDLVLTDEQIMLLTFKMTDGDMVPLSDLIEDEAITEDVFMTQAVCFVRKDGAVSAFGHVFPEAGIYFPFIDEGVFTEAIASEEPIEHTKTVIHKLDRKFLPDDNGGSSGGALNVVFVYEDMLNGATYRATCNATFQEVMDAMQNLTLGSVTAVKRVGGTIDTKICELSYVPADGNTGLFGGQECIWLQPTTGTQWGIYMFLNADGTAGYSRF